VRLAILLLAATFAGAQCIPLEQAASKIGETTCVRAKVLKVVEGSRGAHFLDLCPDYRNCPLTVVVFEKDLKQVGNIRLLEGKDIELHGKVVKYKGRAEIVLSDRSQLKGEVRLPPPPSEYDADRRGQFSAGKFEKKRR
jgi:hypothetical protein